MNGMMGGRAREGRRMGEGWGEERKEKDGRIEKEEWRCREEVECRMVERAWGRGEGVSERTRTASKDSASPCKRAVGVGRS